MKTKTEKPKASKKPSRWKPVKIIEGTTWEDLKRIQVVHDDLPAKKK